MFKLTLSLACAFFVFQNTPITDAHAHPPDHNGRDTVFSLKELLTLTRENAPALRSDSMRIGISRAEAGIIRNRVSPDLTLHYQVDAGSNNNVASPHFGFGILPQNPGGRRPNSNLDPVTGNIGIANFQWEFYNFGYYDSQNDVAEAEVSVAQKYFEQRKYDIQSYTIYHYLTLLQKTELISIQQRSIERNREITHSIRALARSGIRPGVDTSMAGAELSRAVLREIELKNDRQQAQIALAALSGLEPALIVADTLAENIFIREDLAIMPDFHRHAHPLLRYQESLIWKNELSERMIQKKYLPKLYLASAVWGRGSRINGYEQYGPWLNGFGMQRFNYLLGVGISFNIYDLRRKRLDMTSQHLQTALAMQRLTEQEVAIQANIREADVLVTTARERLEELPRQKQAASAAYRQKFALYKNGLTDIVELNIAQNLLYRAERDQIIAKYDYIIALYKKAIAQNDLEPFINLFQQSL